MSGTAVFSVGLLLRDGKFVVVTNSRMRRTIASYPSSHLHHDDATADVSHPERPRDAMVRYADELKALLHQRTLKRTGRSKDCL